MDSVEQVLANGVQTFLLNKCISKSFLINVRSLGSIVVNLAPGGVDCLGASSPVTSCSALGNSTKLGIRESTNQQWQATMIDALVIYYISSLLALTPLSGLSQPHGLLCPYFILTTTLWSRLGQETGLVPRLPSERPATFALSSLCYILLAVRSPCLFLSHLSANWT